MSWLSKWWKGGGREVVLPPAIGAAASGGNVGRAVGQAVLADVLTPERMSDVNSIRDNILIIKIEVKANSVIWTAVDEIEKSLDRLVGGLK